MGVAPGAPVRVLACALQTGASGMRVGWSHPRLEVECSEMEQDRVAEAIAGAAPTGRRVDPRDFPGHGVHRPCSQIGRPRTIAVKIPTEVLPHHPGRLHHRGQLASRRKRQPRYPAPRRHPLSVSFHSCDDISLSADGLPVRTQASPSRDSSFRRSGPTRRGPSSHRCCVPVSIRSPASSSER